MKKTKPTLNFPLKIYHDDVHFIELHDYHDSEGESDLMSEGVFDDPYGRSYPPPPDPPLIIPAATTRNKNIHTTLMENEMPTLKLDSTNSIDSFSLCEIKSSFEEMNKLHHEEEEEEEWEVLSDDANNSTKSIKSLDSSFKIVSSSDVESVK
eukprot:529650-Ditylum_brightwellii.AAC.1